MRIAIDESGSLFPNRGPSRFPPVLDAICNRARHFKVEIAFSIPNLSRTDINLRLATDHVVKCRGWLMKTIGTDVYGVIKRPRRVWFVEFEYEDDKLGKRTDSISYPWWKLLPYTELFDSYATSGAELKALEALAGMEEGTMPDWGVADLPTAPVVSIDVSRVGKRQGRHSVRSVN
jgi:hypothetical protein